VSLRASARIQVKADRALGRPTDPRIVALSGMEETMSTEETTPAPVTPVELRATREWLGLPVERLATVLGNRPDQVRRWETGRAPIPAGVRDDLLAIVGDTDDAYRHFHSEAIAEKQLVIWDDDDAFSIAVPHYADLGARWHRQLAARIAHETGARLVPANPKERHDHQP
jgi:DNA-binding transcriptional regulator YiaG